MVEHDTKLGLDLGKVILTNEDGIVSGECIIYVGPEPWEGMWRNRHQLMSIFARYNTVFYVEPRLPFRKLFKEIWSGNISLKHIFGRLFSVTSEGVNVYHSPIWLPINEKPILKQFTNYLWKYLLVRKIKKLTSKKPILWLSRPHFVALAGLLDEKLLVYHVVDEYLGYFGHSLNDKEKIKKNEEMLLRKADIVIVVSTNLLESKSKLNSNTFLVPNAVNYKSYQSAGPTVIENIQRPMIGYSGLISNRLNIEKLMSLADRRPDWNLLFIGDITFGQVRDEILSLKERDNVFFLGRKNITELPSYLKSLDVGMIPYRVGLQAENVSPLKLYEYFAAGIPVVTTDFCAAREFNKIAYVSKTFHDLEKNIQDCLKMAELVNKRIARGHKMASENTWDDRVKEISKIVTDFSHTK